MLIAPLLLLSVLCTCLAVIAQLADLDALAATSAAFALLFVVMTL
jgi:hypothetical protein